MQIKRICLILVMFLWAVSFIVPNEISAHATLLEATPAPDSHFETSPSNIVLTFNERMEKKLFYIHVLGTDGKKVTKNEATMSDDQRQISLDLPPLSDGVYTITYKIISADGHPIGGSYIISVGNAEIASGSQGMSDLHAGHHMEEFTIQQMIVFSSRILFFMSFLLLIGWIFWNLLNRTDSQEIQKRNQQVSLVLKWGFLVTTLLMILMHLSDLLSEWNISELLSLLFGTNIGISFIGLITLAFVSFVVLQRTKWIDGLWIGLALLAKSLNGHAVAFDSPIITIILDIIHLFASAIWAGGLLYILVYWRKDRDHAIQFLPQFSRVALFTIIALVISGSIYTFWFIPHLKFLLYTTWGWLLMAKVAVVLIVICIGTLLRRRMKKQHANLTTLLRIDFSAMMVIVVIVGLFTYMNPVPVNEPFYWHEMGQDIHMTAIVHPKTVGHNQFTAEVWIDEDQEQPKNVQMRFKYKPDEEMYPIEVPLELANIDEESTFGFTLYTYKGEGSYLPFAGTWEIEVRVLQATDEEKVYTNEFTIYKLN